MTERRPNDRVSIVIPCFNAGDLLVEAVESALAQTHDDVEVVIVDDGSTDARTIQIVETSHWPRTRVIRQANAGPAAARNAAISAATGRYILPLDADDRIGPEYASEALRVLRRQPEVGVVYCRAEKFGAEGGPWLLPAYNLRELVIDNVVFVTAMFRREDWERVGGYSEGLRHGVEDYDFWIKIVSLGREVVQLEGCHFFYRVQQQSRTTGFSRDRAVMVRTYADIVRANAPFFLENMEFIFEHRFELYDELQGYRKRYSGVEVYLARFPLLGRIFDAGLRVMVASLRALQRAKNFMHRAIITPLAGLLGLSGMLGGCDDSPPPGRPGAVAPAASPVAVPPNSNPATPVTAETLQAAEWTRQACDLTVPEGGKALVHHAGTATLFEGFFIGPDNTPAGVFDFVLKGPDRSYAVRTETGFLRPDVASYFKDDALAGAGFRFSSTLEGVPAGTYDVDFHVGKAGKRYFCESGKQVQIG